MWAAELLFHRWQSILDMAGECKHSFAFPEAILQAIRFRSYSSRWRVNLTNSCTSLINQNGFAKPNSDVALHPVVAAAQRGISIGSVKQKGRKRCAELGISPIYELKAGLLFHMNITCRGKKNNQKHMLSPVWGQKFCCDRLLMGILSF
jgi:hypothetical protein